MPSKSLAIITLTSILPIIVFFSTTSYFSFLAEKVNPPPTSRFQFIRPTNYLPESILQSNKLVPETLSKKRKLDKNVIQAVNSKSFFSKPVEVPVQEKQECVVLTPDGAKYGENHLPVNSRTYCRSTSPICLSADTLYGFPSPEHYECKLKTLSTTQALDKTQCGHLHESVKCVHGWFPNPSQPHCPTSEGQTSPPETATKSLNGYAVIVPAYPHLGNIYHYSHVLVNAFQLAREAVVNNNKGRKDVVFIFRGESPYDLGKWQSFTFDSLRSKLEASNISTSWYSFGMKTTRDKLQESTDTVCVNSAVLMGPRGSVNAWPFQTSRHQKHRELTIRQRPVLNRGQLFRQLESTNRLTVPIESIRFRSSTYFSANVSSEISNFPLLPPYPNRIWIDLPPPTIAYSRRNSYPDPQPGQVLKGPVRRLSDSDEKYLYYTLNTISEKYNFTLQTLQPTSDTPISDQVSSFHQAGVLIGLHGANLMNAMFMTPFSGLIEINPTKLQCYVSGANSGLVSWLVDPGRIATPEESNCLKTPRFKKCWKSLVQRRVLLDDPNTRTKLEHTIEESIVFVRKLRNRFSKSGKIPLVLDAKNSMYKIVWNHE